MYIALINDDPFIIEIDIIINCESQMDIKIYPPTVNTIVYELLKPKYEKTPNLWVKSIVKQSNNKCGTIIINSKYTTDTISYAIQINHYVNTTISALFAILTVLLVCRIFMISALFVVTKKCKPFRK